MPASSRQLFGPVLVGLTRCLVASLASRAAPRVRLPVARLHAGRPASAAGRVAIMSAAIPAAEERKLRFDELDLLPGTLGALSRDFGYAECSQIQQAAIPLGLEGYDLLARAQTGTGKTLAFLIPVVERMVRSRKGSQPGHAGAVVIAPTRELAAQIATEAERLCAQLVPSVEVQLFVGGTRIESERKRIGRNGCAPLLVCTPGRLIDHIEGTPGFAQRLAGVGALVLDEVDTLLEAGFRPALEKILKALPPPGKRQSLLFSATLSDDIRQIAAKAMRPGDASRSVDCVGEGQSDITAELLEQRYVSCKQSDLLPTLWATIAKAQAGGLGKVIVFCPTARMTSLMARLAEMSRSFDNVLEIHSRKTQGARERVSAEFRLAKSAVLFTSDVSARGVDYPDVSLVLQLGAASTKEQYVHRTGRSARAGKNGLAVLLLCDYESPFLNEIVPLGVTPLTSADSVWSSPNDFSNSPKLAEALKRTMADSDGESNAALAYTSWLGYYRGKCKEFGWDSEELVTKANMFALSLGFERPPEVDLKAARMMNVHNTRGIRIAPKGSGGSKFSARKPMGSAGPPRPGSAYPTRPGGAFPPRPMGSAGPPRPGSPLPARRAPAPGSGTTGSSGRGYNSPPRDRSTPGADRRGPGPR